MLLNQLHTSPQNKGYWFFIYKINVGPVGRNVFVLAFLVVMKMNYSLGQKGIPQSRGCGVIWWVESACERPYSIYTWCWLFLATKVMGSKNWPLLSSLPVHPWHEASRRRDLLFYFQTRFVSRLKKHLLRDGGQRDLC